MRSQCPPVIKRGKIVTLSRAMSAHVDRIAESRCLDPGTIVESLIVKAAIATNGPGVEETVSLSIEKGTPVARMVAFIKTLEPQLSTAEILSGWIRASAADASESPELVMMLRYASAEFGSKKKGGAK